MEDCVVCFEKTKSRTACNHVLCMSCQTQLIKPECPYCRQSIAPPRKITMAFSEFSFLFHRFYRNNPIFNNLKIGKDNHSLFTYNTLFYLQEQQTFDDCGIEIEIYKIRKERSYHSSVTIVEFKTKGLDHVKSIPHEYRYSPFSQQGQIIENYFDTKEIFC